MKNLAILILVSALIFYGCNEDNSTDTKGPATISFRLTDAPATFDEVNINIVGAQAIINDSTINLDVQAGVYNLLNLVNGHDTVIVDQQIPSGKLSQIRLILGSGNTVVVGTQSFDLTTPSAQQSGLKLNVQATFLPGIAYEYIIDFDAARSIVTTGNGKYILKPVLKVFSKAVSGAIEGVISPVNARPLIYAISEQFDSVSTHSDTISGKFMFRGLSAGTYNLSFLPQNPYRDSTLHGISVLNAEITKIDTLKF
jgi:hypothetical protein